MVPGSDYHAIWRYFPVMKFGKQNIVMNCFLVKAKEHRRNELFTYLCFLILIWFNKFSADEFLPQIPNNVGLYTWRLVAWAKSTAGGAAQNA